MLNTDSVFHTLFFFVVVFDFILLCFGFILFFWYQQKISFTSKCTSHKFQLYTQIFTSYFTVILL